MSDERFLQPALELAARAIALIAIEAHAGNNHAAREELAVFRDTIIRHHDLLYGAYCIAIMMIPDKEQAHE